MPVGKCGVECLPLGVVPKGEVDIVTGGDNGFPSFFTNHLRCNCSSDVITRRVGKSDKFYARFAVFTDGILSKGFGKEEYAVARALLRGDTDEMAETIDFYRLSGIAHVFAVSGMHVGLVFAAFTLLFKPVRVRKIYKSLAISCLLFIYAYLCGIKEIKIL